MAQVLALVLAAAAASLMLGFNPMALGIIASMAWMAYALWLADSSPPTVRQEIDEAVQRSRSVLGDLEAPSRRGAPDR